MSCPLWLALRFPLLPLEGPVPDPGLPVLIQESRRVLLANAPAEQQGVLPGMPVTTARALCPTLQVIDRTPEQEARLLEARGRDLLAISPMVSLSSPDALLLEIGGCLKLHGGIEALLARLLAILEDRQWPAEIGLGHTPLAALQMSYQSLRDSLACLEAGAADPSACIRSLGKRPINSLTLSDRQKEKLLAPGFRLLGELFPLPRQALGKRFGKDFLRWLEKLLGERPDPRQPLGQITPFRREIDFDQPVAISAQLAQPMRQLLSELEVWLRSRQQVTRAIRWRLLPEQHDSHHQAPVSLLVRRARPDLDMTVWLDLSLRRLAEQSLKGAIARLQLDCARPRPAPLASDSLFQRIERPDMQGLLEKLPADLQIYRPGLADAQLPELAEARHPPQEKPPQEPDSPVSLSTPPLWLFEPPQPLQAGSDNALNWRGQTLTVLATRQTLSSHWWQGSSAGEIRREYHLARHQDGWYGRVFRDGQGNWWLQGVV